VNKRAIRLTESQLRKIIMQELEQLDELSMSQAKRVGPVRTFIQHMNGAKMALGELYQNVSDPQSADQIQGLLNAVNRIVAAVNNMPGLRGE